MKDLSKLPDPQKHLYISLFKSAIRILAGAALCGGFIFITGVLLIVAELLGILEEIVQ